MVSELEKYSIHKYSILCAQISIKTMKRLLLCLIRKTLFLYIYGILIISEYCVKNKEVILKVYYNLRTVYSILYSAIYNVLFNIFF